MKVNSSATIKVIDQQQSICPKSYVPDFSEKFAHFGQAWFMWLKIPKKKEIILCLNLNHFYCR